MTREEYEEFHEQWHQRKCENCGQKFETADFRQIWCDTCLLDEAERENEETSADDGPVSYAECCALCKNFNPGLGGNINSIVGFCEENIKKTWSHNTCTCFFLDDAVAKEFKINL